MKKIVLFALLSTVAVARAQLSYPPHADAPGSTAIHKGSSTFTGWATGVEVTRGYVDIADVTATYNGSNKASYGVPEDAIGIPGMDAVSLGDAGTAIVTFARPIANGPGFDFAVFENGTDTFLELAFVEVSSDGVNYFRFPAHSETQTATPVGGFGAIDARNLNNLAGKYRVDYGTPFNLDDVPNNALLDKNNITHIKLIDVVGSLDPQYATSDSFGNKINDPYPTPFHSCGFDLTGIGVINQRSLGTDDNQMAALRLYPNPASDLLTIEFDNAGTAQIAIYDVSGREVIAQQVTGSGTIGVSALNVGVYLVVINCNNRVATKRIIINR